MYNVKITVENLKVLNDRCTGKFKIFKNIMIMNMIVYPYKKESESTPILPDSKQSKIDLNQFINLTRCKDMRKISDYPFMHLLYSQLLVCQRVCLQNTVCLICK